jgi:hypothetical protein
MAAGRDLDVGGAPMFLVNGHKHPGVLDAPFFDDLLR